MVTTLCPGASGCNLCGKCTPGSSLIGKNGLVIGLFQSRSTRWNVSEADNPCNKFSQYSHVVHVSHPDVLGIVNNRWY